MPYFPSVRAFNLDQIKNFPFVGKDGIQTVTVKYLEICLSRYEPRGRAGVFVYRDEESFYFTGFAGQVILPCVLRDGFDKVDIMDFFYPALPRAVRRLAEQDGLLPVIAKDAAFHLKYLRIRFFHENMFTVNFLISCLR